MILLVLLPINYVLAEERDSDLDGVPDPSDRYPFDYDNDGMPDVWEKKYSLRYDMDDANEDPDNDNIKNIDEYKQGTDPLVSEKTKERVELELLSPVEKTIARGLIWIGVILLLLFLVGFILYRTHIFRVFRFLHHVSKEHFEHHEKEQKAMLRNPYQPIYRTRVLQHPRDISWQQQNFPKYTPRHQEPTVPATKTETQQNIAPEKYQQPKKSFENIKEKKPEDIFGRLSKHIDEYKNEKV